MAMNVIFCFILYMFCVFILIFFICQWSIFHDFLSFEKIDGHFSFFLNFLPVFFFFRKLFDFSFFYCKAFINRFLFIIVFVVVIFNYFLSFSHHYFLLKFTFFFFIVQYLQDLNAIFPSDDQVPKTTTIIFKYCIDQ